MFEKITPEAAGVSSREVLALLRSFEARGLRMHSVLLGKGDSLFAEYYWAPFTRDFCHRMYSETKSFVGIAVGILAGEGKIDLDRPLASYFPDKIDRELPEELAAQTVRETLTMRTARTFKGNWFTDADRDRVHLYFDQGEPVHPAGTYFAYDSDGSQVLCALVERISKQPLLEFLRERIFRELGTFGSAEMLRTPTGETWGDSSMICTPRDMISFGRLLMKGGEWNGKQLIPRDYVKEATSVQTSSYHVGGGYRVYGYGYQIWMVEKPGCFAFFGMGDQFTVCMPDKDLIFVCTADNQGYDASCDLVFGTLFDRIWETASKTPLPEDPDAFRELESFASGLNLFSLRGTAEKTVASAVNGKEFVCRENRMGISRFSLRFLPDGTGEFRYRNEQGDKVLPFGLGKNVFAEFPQDGYSDGVGGERTANGFRYRCATSGGWLSGENFVLFCQIIDRYFGSLRVVFCFKGDDAVVHFQKTAEDFLEEYRGELIASPAKEA